MRGGKVFAIPYTYAEIGLTYDRQQIKVATTSMFVSIAEKLRDSLRPPMRLNGKDIQVGFSVGMSQYPEDGSTAMALMASPDRAMYEMKATGRNGFQFSSPSTTGPEEY